MGRTSLQDIRSVGDPLQSWNWDFLLPNMPGTSDSRPFTIKCQTATIPGFQFEKVQVPLHGIELEYAGRLIYTHTFSVTVMETADANTRGMFVRWKELMRSWIANTGSMSDVYKTNGQLILYNDIPSVVRTVNIFGVWPETVDDFGLDGSQSSLVSYNVSFSYDYTIDT